MIASLSFFSVIVTIAVAVTAVAPILLLVLLIRDWRQGKLW